MAGRGPVKSEVLCSIGGFSVTIAKHSVIIAGISVVFKVQVTCPVKWSKGKTTLVMKFFCTSGSLESK